MFNKKLKSLSEDTFFICEIIKKYYACMNAEKLETNIIIKT